MFIIIIDHLLKKEGNFIATYVFSNIPKHGDRNFSDISGNLTNELGRMLALPIGTKPVSR